MAPKRILFFIGSLRSGGKERRLIELLKYLKNKTNYDLLLVMTRGDIHYPDFYKLNVPVQVIRKKWKKNDPTVFYQFYNICKQFSPHIVHTWGRIQSFYALPAIIGQRLPLVNSQITAAPPKSKVMAFDKIIDKVNFKFSKVILSNSKAGIDSFNPPSQKVKVIYNGVSMGRFTNLPDAEQVKSKYGITTPHIVIMAASFTCNKDYELFYEVAEKVTKERGDITFIGAGGYENNDSEYRRLLALSSKNKHILFPGRINDVEALINTCTVGVLFSNRLVHGEGISNAIMEYMALAKPVVANDAGGTREIIINNKNGYLIIDQSIEEIASLIVELIDDQKKRDAIGNLNKQTISEKFSIESMGKAFEKVYHEALTDK